MTKFSFTHCRDCGRLNIYGATCTCGCHPWHVDHTTHGWQPPTNHNQGDNDE